MQDKGVDFNAPVKVDDGCRIWKWKPEDAWNKAKEDALKWSEAFYDAGYHKQCYNRLTEPFQMIKVLVTATEFANFFWLRNDNAADPTLHELARLMKEEYDGSEPKVLKPGEWHLPYLNTLKSKKGLLYGDWIKHPIEPSPAQAFQEYTLEDAIKVSAARCAAVSFRNTDYTLEKSLEVYERLVGDERKHASAFEHQACPMQDPHEMNVNDSQWNGTWEDGVTHADNEGFMWSGNFKNWIQYRQLIPGHNKANY